MNHPKHTCFVGDKDVCVFVCVRKRACVSFSGFPVEHEITQEGEEELQLIFYFFWLAVICGRKQQDFALRENSEAAQREYLQLLVFFFFF